MPRFIIRKGQRYYYYDTYDNPKSAKRVANYYRNKTGSRYFVINQECGFFNPIIKRHLYLNKVIRP